jgi:hypothetical protein
MNSHNLIRISQNPGWKLENEPAKHLGTSEHPGDNRSDETPVSVSTRMCIPPSKRLMAVTSIRIEVGIFHGYTDYWWLLFYIYIYILGHNMAMIHFPQLGCSPSKWWPRVTGQSNEPLQCDFARALLGLGNSQAHAIHVLMLCLLVKKENPDLWIPAFCINSGDISLGGKYLMIFPRCNIMYQWYLQGGTPQWCLLGYSPTDFRYTLW